MTRLFKNAAVWTVVVIIAFHSLQEQQVQRVLEFRAKDQKRVEELEKNAASAQVARRMEAHLSVLNRRAEYEQELEKARGGGLAAIVKDSRLSIAEMLGAIARSVTPEGSKVEVSVERFTDFTVSVELPAVLPVAELATISGKLLELGTPYLHRLSFFAERRLIGEIDPLFIASAAKQKIPATEVIVQSLLTSVADEPKPAQAAAKVSVSPERSSEVAVPFERIMKEWSDAYRANMEAVSKVLDRLNAAVDLQTLKTKGDVRLRLKSVEEAGTQIAKAERYFPACLDALKAQLTPATDPLVVNITMREAESAHGGEIRLMKPLLSELTAFQFTVRRLLQTLDAPGANWEITQSGTIQFENAATLTAFKLRIRDVEASIQKVNQAAQAMSAAAGRK